MKTHILTTGKAPNEFFRSFLPEFKQAIEDQDKTILHISDAMFYEVYILPISSRTIT